MRKSKPKKRYFLPDPIFKDTLVTQFVNNLMKDGKKSVAEKIVYDCFSIIKKKEKVESPIDIFKKALKKLGSLTSNS